MDTPSLHPSLHPLIPGQKLAGDWFNGSVPGNIVVGPGTMINSSACFKEYRARGAVGLQIGEHVTIWGASLCPEAEAIIEIGDYSYIAHASLACTSRITLGKRVFVSGGVTITDCDFHPLAAAARMFDSIAISPVGDRSRRPFMEARPVTIGDDVWIGYNATILKGVHIGSGAVIAPCAVVTGDIKPNTVASGNPIWHG
jgi:acetyltransferase-like isoleucine patch superfamily enzyme